MPIRRLSDTNEEKKLCINLYNKTRHSYIYKSPMAGQTAGQNGLKFFADTHGWLWGVLG